MAGLESRNIGPCLLDYGGTTLGETKGGVTLQMDYQTAKTTCDRFGETARQKIITGAEVKVLANLTEVSVAILEDLIPGAVLAGNTLTVSSSVGANLLDSAQVLILKPIVEGVADTDPTTWITLAKASVTPKFDVPFKLDDQRVWAVEFEGHPDADDVIAVFGGTVSS